MANDAADRMAEALAECLQELLAITEPHTADLGDADWRRAAVYAYGAAAKWNAYQSLLRDREAAARDTAHARTRVKLKGDPPEGD